MKVLINGLLLLALAGCATEAPDRSHAVGQPYGRVTVAILAPPPDLHRVVLQRVDGKPIAGCGSLRVRDNVSMMVVGPSFDVNDARSDFDLPPGEHVLSLTAIVDRPEAKVFAPPPRSHLADKDAGLLRLTVEAGRHYFVAAQVTPSQPEQWRAVIYRVEDIPGYGTPAR